MNPRRKMIAMAKYGNPTSDSGRLTITTYDHGKTKDVHDTGSGKHNDEDAGSQDTNGEGEQ